MNYDYKAYPSYIAIGDRPKQNPVSLEERLDPSSTALVVIDVQNDFCDRAGRNGLDGEDLSQILAILGPLRALIRKARQKHIFTIFVRSSYDAIRGRALREQQRTRRGFDGGICREGTWGIEFVQGTGPEGLPGEAVVTKHSYGAFGGTEIDLLLRSNGIKSVVLAGVGTETSVESIARDAFFLDYKVLIAKDCCASYSRRFHNSSLTAMSLVSGVTPVMESAKIIDIWEKDTSLTRGWQAEVKRSRALGTLAARLEPVHTALILIDVQNDLCSAGGRLDQLGQSLSLISKTIPNIARLLESARAAGVKVFYLRSEHTSVTSNIGTPSWHMGGNKAANWAGLKIAPNGGSLGESCVRGSWGAEIVAAVAPLPEEIVITKHRYSGFTDTRLDQLLRSNEIRTVVVTGFMTNSSVESTARDAAMRDYYLVIGEDCVATPEDAVDLHSVSLRAIQNHFGLVKSSEQIASIWRRLSSSLKP